MVYKISGITRRIIREPTSSRTIRKLPLTNRSGLGVLNNPSQESTFGGCIFLDEDEDFPYLMMFYPITSSKKASLDSKHPSNISWPYKFRLFFRPLHLHCKVEFFQNARNLLAGYYRTSPKPQHVFIFPCSSPLF